MTGRMIWLIANDAMRFVKNDILDMVDDPRKAMHLQDKRAAEFWLKRHPGIAGLYPLLYYSDTGLTTSLGEVKVMPEINRFKYNGGFSTGNGTINGGDIADYIGDDGVTHRVVIVGEVYSDGDADIAHYFDGNPGPGNVKWRHLRVLDDSVKKSFKAFWESGEDLEKRCEYCDRQLKNRSLCSRHDCPLQSASPMERERERLIRLLVRECPAQAHRILEAIYEAGFSVISTIQLQSDQVDHSGGER